MGPLSVRFTSAGIPIKATEAETSHVEKLDAPPKEEATSPGGLGGQRGDEAPSALSLPFFTLAMLDVPPRVVGYGVPKLLQSDDPLLAGEVRLSVVLGADGSVKEVRILDAGGLPEPFSRSAVDALSRTDFEAGIRGGRPVPVQFTVVVKFGQDAEK